MKNTIATTTEAFARLWDTLAFRVLVIGVGLAGVPVALLVTLAQGLQTR